MITYWENRNEKQTYYAETIFLMSELWRNKQVTEKNEFNDADIKSDFKLKCVTFLVQFYIL